MGILIGGIGSSHAPSIAHAWDMGDAGQAVWKPVFDSYARVKNWLKAQRVDTLVVFYNDHLNHFQFSNYPTFALGVADEMPVCDEGEGPRPFPPVVGNPDLGWHLATSLVRDEFDITVCQEQGLDHGVLSVLPLLDDVPWSIRVVPIEVNVLREPLPSPQRCFRIGQAVGRAIRSFDQDARVVVMSTGGLSHQLHGPDFGATHPEWDNRFMDLLISQPEVLSAASHEDYMVRGGVEGAEMMMWLAMRGALQANGVPFSVVERHYWAPMLTGYGLLALEVEA